MALTFRKALPPEGGDADRVLRAAFAPYIRKLGRELTADYYAWVGAAVDRGEVFVALEDAEVVGVAVTERRHDSLYIDRLAVDPARQGNGLGSWVLARLEEVARSSGLPGLSLETAEMMDHLVRLYRRNGFEIVGRGLPAHGKDSHTRVRMAKRLAAANF
jgi:ribosomal protein S18 acetylase RimI-like enzyme